jgi:hypothetical protein
MRSMSNRRELGKRRLRLLSAAAPPTQLTRCGEIVAQVTLLWQRAATCTTGETAVKPRLYRHRLDSQLMANQLNALGFDVSFDGVTAQQWFSDVAASNFDSMIQWGEQGRNPITYFEEWLDYRQVTPGGSSGDWELFNSPQAQQALDQFTGTNDATTQQAALNAPADRLHAGTGNPAAVRGGLVRVQHP